jgi:hypothetical protein
MDELNIEDFKQLVEFYVKRTTDAELKNVELQLIVNRTKIEKATFGARIRSLEVEIEKLSEELKTKDIGKNIKKTTKVKELE